MSDLAVVMSCVSLDTGKCDRLEFIIRHLHHSETCSQPQQCEFIRHKYVTWSDENSRIFELNLPRGNDQAALYRHYDQCVSKKTQNDSRIRQRFKMAMKKSQWFNLLPGDGLKYQFTEAGLQKLEAMPLPSHHEPGATVVSCDMTQNGLASGFSQMEIGSCGSDETELAYRGDYPYTPSVVDLMNHLMNDAEMERCRFRDCVPSSGDFAVFATDVRNNIVNLSGILASSMQVFTYQNASNWDPARETGLLLSAYNDPASEGSRGFRILVNSEGVSSEHAQNVAFFGPPELTPIFLNGPCDEIMKCVSENSLRHADSILSLLEPFSGGALCFFWKKYSVTDLPEDFPLAEELQQLCWKLHCVRLVRDARSRKPDKYGTVREKTHRLKMCIETLKDGTQELIYDEHLIKSYEVMDLLRNVCSILCLGTRAHHCNASSFIGVSKSNVARDPALLLRFEVTNNFLQWLVSLYPERRTGMPLSVDTGSSPSTLSLPGLRHAGGGY